MIPLKGLKIALLFQILNNSYFLLRLLDELLDVKFLMNDRESANFKRSEYMSFFALNNCVLFDFFKIKQNKVLIKLLMTIF